MWTASVGVVFGLALAALVTRLVSSYLVGIRALDVVSFGSMAALLGVVARMATYIPARRAAAIDPVRALKME